LNYNQSHANKGNHETYTTRAAGYGKTLRDVGAYMGHASYGSSVQIEASGASGLVLWQDCVFV